MGDVVPFTVVEGPEAWTAADYSNPDDYIYHFSPSDLAELETAVAGALQQGKDIKVLLNCWCCVLPTECQPLLFDALVFFK